MVVKEILSPVSRNKGLYVKINGQNFFDQPVKNNLRTYDNI